MLHKFNSAFTLIETVVVFGILSGLSVGVISLINPTEQKLRGVDLKTTVFAGQFHASINRYYVTHATTPYSQNLSATPLTSPEVSTIISVMTSENELKSDLPDTNILSRLYLTTTTRPPNHATCFRPASNKFQNDSELCHYNLYGQVLSSPTPDNCYICIANFNQAALTITASPTPTISVVDSCDQDPQYPHYPTTSMYLDNQFSQYGCDRFSVFDYSCDNYVWSTWDTDCSQYCQPGQRCLSKKYTATYTNPVDFFNCLSHSSEAQEYYCTDEPYANCINHPSISSPSDFNYGCTDPVRPYQWK